MQLSDDELNATVALYRELKENQTNTAEQLGIARSTLQQRLQAAADRGISTKLLSNGLAEGQEVAGTTTLYKRKGEDGKIVLQWVKGRKSLANGDPIPAIRAAFEDFKGLALPPEKAETFQPEPRLLTVYPIADLHLGMYSWKAETGNDYDVQIADRIFTDRIMDLIQRSPPSEQAIILNLGDFFHADNNMKLTERSGNSLDVDSRYARVQRAGTDLLLQATHLALQKHNRVLIRNIPGNHDPNATQNLTIALEAYFHATDRVTVDPDPGPFFFHKHGRTLIGAAHGDYAKPHQMVNIMTAKRSKDWGETDFRYIYMGHIHRKSSGANLELGNEIGGAVWETFQTIAPRDAWGNGMGFTAGRALQAIVLDKELGEVMRLTSPVKGRP